MQCNIILQYKGTLTNFENMLSEGSQTQKSTYSMSFSLQNSCHLAKQKLDIH